MYEEMYTECSCGETLELQVLHSQAGYYLGYFCMNCGPWSRESGYYKTKEEAEKMLRIQEKDNFIDEE